MPFVLGSQKFPLKQKKKVVIGFRDPIYDSKNQSTDLGINVAKEIELLRYKGTGRKAWHDIFRGRSLQKKLV